MAAVGCTGSGDPLACLRQVSVPVLLASAGSTRNPNFFTIVDGKVLPDQPRVLFDAGDFARVPYVLGSNSDEGTLFFVGVPPVTTEEEYLAALTHFWGDLADEVAAVYPPADFPSPQDALVRAYGDSDFVCPTYDTARRAAAASADVWLYNFARPQPFPQLAPLKLGATHGAEIGYVFHSVDFGPYPIDQTISDAMQGYWTRFARSGDPNGEGALPWPRYDDGSDRRLNIDAELSVISGFRRPECEFWWGVYDAEFE